MLASREDLRENFFFLIQSLPNNDQIRHLIFGYFFSLSHMDVLATVIQLNLRHLQIIRMWKQPIGPSKIISYTKQQQLFLMLCNHVSRFYSLNALWHVFTLHTSTTMPIFSTKYSQTSLQIQQVRHRKAIPCLDYEKNQNGGRTMMSRWAQEVTTQQLVHQLTRPKRSRSEHHTQPHSLILDPVATERFRWQRA